MLFVGATTARADADDTLNLTVGINEQYTNNLFLLPAGVDAQAVLGTSTKSDWITASSVGLKFNKPYSLQRFELEATVIDTRYRTFDYLDFTALNYAAAWRWQVTPSLHGNLTTFRNEGLNSFSDYRRYNQQNIRTNENSAFDAIYEIGGGWRLFGGVSQTTRTNSKIFVQEGDTRVNAANAGVGYAFRSGSYLRFQSRFGQGEYVNRPEPIPVVLLDNRFDERENGVQLTWKPTGKTSLDARAAYLQNISDNYSARDFSGAIGNLNLNWEISGKTSLMATLARALSSYQSISSSYTRTDRLTLATYWRIREKAGLRVSYDYAAQDYLGAIAATAQNGRADTTRTGSIAFDWNPWRNVTVSTSLQRAKRDSNQPGNDYAANSANFSAQVSF